MNQNCTCGTTSKTHPKFFIRHSDIVFDKRRAYVESVCAILDASRFGHRRRGDLVADLEWLEVEEAVFFEMSDDEMAPLYALSPVGRLGYQVVEAEYRKARRMRVVNVLPDGFHRAAAQPNIRGGFGRGSPSPVGS